MYNFKIVKYKERKEREKWFKYYPYTKQLSTIQVYTTNPSYVGTSIAADNLDKMRWSKFWYRKQLDAIYNIEITVDHVKNVHCNKDGFNDFWGQLSSWDYLKHPIPNVFYHRKLHNLKIKIQSRISLKEI